MNLISFDMNHINNALSQKKVNPIDGIIGADVLKKSKAILDYKLDKLYLKLWFKGFNYVFNGVLKNNINRGQNKTYK